jgi:anti-anti-sigma regulatory factor
MLRIVEENATNDSMTLRLDGRLVSQWVGVLRQSCEQVFQNSSRLILDLAGVSFADHEGVQLLRQLEQQQVAFINCSPFLQEQIKQPTNALLPPASERMDAH